MLDKAKLVRKEFCQDTNDYRTGGVFHDSFLAPKLKYCSVINEFGIIQSHLTF